MMMSQLLVLLLLFLCGLAVVQALSAEITSCPGNL
jgi:hypothetical protein